MHKFFIFLATIAATLAITGIAYCLTCDTYTCKATVQSTYDNGVIVVIDERGFIWQLDCDGCAKGDTVKLTIDDTKNAPYGEVVEVKIL